MKTLLILRHAKSSWRDSQLSDYDRPLNERGQRDAPRMGRLLAEQGLDPAAVLCSSAKRARHTAESVIESSGSGVEVTLVEDLYLAPAENYLETLRQQPDRHACVMVVGHNPGLEELVLVLTDCDERLPTAALARVELDIGSWNELAGHGQGRLADLWRPRELE